MSKREINVSRYLLRSLLGGCALCACSAGMAQTSATQPTAGNSDDGSPETSTEIIVTATKRAESIQDIPLSVTAISQDTLVRSGATSFENYATSVPNLSFGFSGSGRQVSRSFQIRGITGSGTSALYIGETPVPTSVDPRVIDLDRIEVLRGPQGSLFGARSMGGLVRLIPASPDPDEFAAKAHVGAANVNKGGWDYSADATVNLPLSPRAALRVTGYYLKEAGFIDRLVDPDASLLIQPTVASVGFANGNERLHKDINDGETYGIMAALTLKAGDALTLTPRVLYQRTKSDGPNFVDNNVNNLVKIRQFDVDESGKDKFWLASLEAELDVGPGRIVSSSSYFERDTLDIEDSTRFIASRLGGRVRAAVGAPSVTSQIQSEKRTTQELRFVSDFDGSIDLIAGVFYQKVKTDGGFPPQSIIPTGSPLTLFGLAVGDSFFSLRQTVNSNEYGVFGEATWEVVPTLKLTAGGRYFSVKSRNTRQDGGVLYTKLFGIQPTNFAGKTSDSGFNPRVALTWEPSRTTTVYLNAAKGFRPGAPNLGKAICTANGFMNVPDVVDADSLWNYEAGIKNRFLGGRISTDIAAYKIVWKNRRTTVVSDCGLGFGYADNVGEAQSEGFEFSFAATITDNVKIDGGVGYTNSRITDNGGLANVIVGTRLADVPKLSGGLALDVGQDFGSARGYGRIDIRYVGDSTSAQRNDRPEYALLNLRAGVQFNGFDVSVFANNVTDKRANLSDPPELSDSLNLIAINRPRTIGVDVRTRF